MVKVIVSPPPSHRRPRALCWNLLLSYWTVMVAILGGSAVSVYEFTEHSLYKQLDRRLEILAQAASHSSIALNELYAERPDGDVAQNAASLPITLSLDGDRDLDIPWQQLLETDRGVEWFDANLHLVGSTGTLLYSLPPQTGSQTLQQGKVRSVTIAVYAKGQERLEGYVRTSEATQEIETLLRELRWGLFGGGAIVLGVTGLGGIWLTRQSLKPIEQSFQQLQQFTADAAHELRSPLAVIKTSIQVMQHYPERLHPQDLKKVNAIATTTNHTIRLVEDLLLLSRIDVEAITHHRDWQELPLKSILSDVFDLLQPRARDKKITVRTQLPSAVRVRGDALQLTRLFRNLLENAIYYTLPGGNVTIALKSSDRHAIVSVTDTGIGIAPEDVPFVFDRFWQADRARSRWEWEGGMGMGLAIAQSIAHNHGGQISLTSQVGVGSCFQVRLPLA